MYSPIITSRDLAHVQRYGGPTDSTTGLTTPLPFILTYHPLSTIDAYIAHFNTLINMDLWEEKWRIEYTDPTRRTRMKDGLSPLFPDEEEFIQNEKILCTFDYGHFARSYAYIDSWEIGKSRYIPNTAQLILNDARAEMEERMVAIMLFQIKARQVGNSTDNQVCAAHRLLFHPDTKWVTAAADPDRTRKLAGKMELVVDNIPWWLHPLRNHPDGYQYSDINITRSAKSDEFIRIPSQNTIVTLYHGSSKTNRMAAGETPTGGHLSELLEFNSLHADVEDSLIKAMHEHPRTFLNLETTGDWKGSELNAMWDDAKRYYPAHQSRLKPQFIPWVVMDTIYPTRAEVRAHFNPVRATWRPSPHTIAYAQKAGKIVNTTPTLAKYLCVEIDESGRSRPRPWVMSDEQMWFYEWDKEQARRKKRLPQWAREVALTDEDAFPIVGQSIFDTELLFEMREEAPPPRSVMAVTGVGETLADLPPRLLPFPMTVDTRVLPIPVEFESTVYKGTFELVPLVSEGISTLDPTGKLLVWEWPIPEEDYFLIVDSAEGIGEGGDRLVVDVFRRGDEEFPDEQVAQWASEYVNGKEAGPIVLAIGGWYSVEKIGRGGESGIREPVVVIELAKGGEACQDWMKERGWREFYYQVDDTPIQYTRRRAGGIVSRGGKMGWDTTSKTRDLVIIEGNAGIKDQDVIVNSIWTLAEMGQFGLNPRKRKIEAIGVGSHDDRVMTLLIGYFVMHQDEFYARMADPGNTPGRRRAARLAQTQAAQRDNTYQIGHAASPVGGHGRGGYMRKGRVDGGEWLI